ncbi:MAG: CusA/CzcA family heavy metal efflux RND transporter, partial [Acidobacteriota bacterium]
MRRPFVVVVALVLVVLGGLAAVRDTRLDAIPDLTDTQVIVVTEFPGQGPQVIEDQVTYPLTSTLLAVPGAETVRGYSYFGLSFAYVLFDEDTDVYWARSRVLESLSSLGDRLPAGVTPRLGPDATGVGWALMYVLESPTHGLDELRSVQDFYLRYALSSVEGVAEVASFGGFTRELHVEVDPVALRAHGVSLTTVKAAIRASNAEIGGRLIEQGERELMVRARGYLEGDPDAAISELRRTSLGAAGSGVPITLGDVAHVTVGPGPRRGIADWNGEGETVGGILVVRADADTRATLDRAKAKLAEAEAGLPDGVTVTIGYDRSGLIDRSIATLTKTLIEESIIVGLVCLLFLFHVRSALVAIVSIPVSILIAFLILRVQGLGLNIMSLGGIAISIGVLVDAAVVMVENAHKHLEAAHRRIAEQEQSTRTLSSQERFDVILTATREVGPTLFFTLLVITVSFLPVFALEAEEGKLFRPLAFTKTWSMAAAALVAVTLMPVLTLAFVRGRIRGEDAHPISRLLRSAYRPALRFAIRRRWVVLTVAALLVASIAIPLGRLGNELMPPLWEGDLLYMPTTAPGLSATEAKEILQATDRAIAEVPEVLSVLGKVGRAETATDPAPLSMLETTIRLRDPSQWRPGLTRQALIAELDAKTRFPGLTNAWTQPIRTRIDMLSTGIRTPVGIKIAGPDLAVLEALARDVGGLVETLPGTSSAYADRVMGGLFLDIDVDRDAIARHGLRIAYFHATSAPGVGGSVVSTVIDGRDRTPIRVRYPRELR